MTEDSSASRATNDTHASPQQDAEDRKGVPPTDSAHSDADSQTERNTEDESPS